MSNESFDPSVYLHSPAAMSKMHIDEYKFILEHPGIQFGVPCIDQYVLPQRPGNLSIICGRPGHGKSSLLARQAKRTAQEIAARGAQYEECVIYVSWEQRAEELEAYFEADDQYSVSDYAWGRVDIEKVKRKAYSRAALPLWMIGNSRTNAHRQTKPLSLDVVFEAIKSMVHKIKKSPKPVLLCFDYAQLIPYDLGRYKNRYEQVKAAIVASKNLALQVGCPVLVAAQAKRDVDTYRYPIPGQNDGQESSGLEQAPDKFFGIWRPWKTNRDDEIIEIPGGHKIPNSPELFILRMSKQRMEDGERTWVLSFDMAELRLAEMEIDRQELAGWD